MTTPRTTPLSGQGGTIDVTPTTLYGVSSGFADQQTALDRGIKTFLDELARYPDGGGRGTAVQSFVASYKRVGTRYLEVWARSVVSVGGVAVGFTLTGNNYAAADAATDPSPAAQPSSRPTPAVLEKAPSYGPVTEFTWGDIDEGQSFVQLALEGVEAVALTIMRPLLEDACRWGKAASILPLPNHLRLESISETWRIPQVSLAMADGNMTGLLGGITDQSNSEWYAAMRNFLRTLWGTSAWGQQRDGYNWSHGHGAGAGANHPVFAVLFDTSEVMVDALHFFARAAADVRDDLHRIYRRAVIDTLPQINLRDGVDLKDLKNLGKGLLDLGKGVVTDLSAGIVLNIDEAAMNSAVEEYNKRVERQARRLDTLMSALNEAYGSAPTFQAESARAEVFGARALTEFKGNPLYTVPGDSEANHRYPIDLANQEGVHGSHVVDKHVGKTDMQLAQRLRDQPTIDAASSFTNMPTAQKVTQDVMDHVGPPRNSGLPNSGVDNPRKIENWLSRPRGDNSILRLDTVQFQHITGRSIEATAPQAGNARDAHSATVVLKYKNGLVPPYVVYTSMPTFP